MVKQKKYLYFRYVFISVVLFHAILVAWSLVSPFSNLVLGWKGYMIYEKKYLLLSLSMYKE